MSSEQAVETEEAPIEGGDSGDFDLSAIFADGSAFEEEKEEDSDPAEPQQDNADEAEEQPETDSEAETEAEEPEDSDEDDEGDTEAESDGAEESKAELPVEVELGDGKKVSLDELKQGYMRQDDYTRKTQELKEQGIAELKQIKDSQMQSLQMAHAMMQEFNPLPAMQKQLQEAMDIGDTEEATRLRLDIRETAERMQRVESALSWEQQQKSSYDAEKERASVEEHYDAQGKALRSKLSMLENEKGQKKFVDTYHSAAKELGWTTDELKERTTRPDYRPDHRDALAYYYAGKYLESVKSAPKSASKLKGKAVTPSKGSRKASSGKNLDSILKHNDSEALLTNYFLG